MKTVEKQKSKQTAEISNGSTEVTKRSGRKRKRRRSDDDPLAKRFEGGQWYCEDLNSHWLVHLDRRWAMILVPLTTIEETTLKVIGRFRFWPLYGYSIRINGIKVSWKKVRKLGGLMLWSPASHSLQSISIDSNHPLSKVDACSLAERLQVCLNSDSFTSCPTDLKTLVSRIEDQIAGKTLSSAFLCCRDERSTIVDVLRSLHEFDGIFGSCQANTDYELIQADEEALIIKTDYLKERMDDYFETIDKNPNAIVMIIGGKNTGKSTTVRQLINAALLSDKLDVDSMAVFDCDPGQTEFTPPAFVSVTRVTEPLFGPPFTHPDMKPACQCFFGELSPANDPDHYLQSLVKTYAEWQKVRDDRKCPLIVNTMGWTEGLGWRLLVDTIKLTKPSLILQLMSNKDHENFSNSVTAASVAEEDGWQSSEEVVKLDYNLHLVLKPLYDSFSSRSHMSPADHRNMTLYAHLSTILEGQPESRVPRYMPRYDSFQCNRDLMTCLMSVPPVKLPWSQVAVHCMCADSTLSSSIILLTINASLVALASLDSSDWDALVVPDTPADHPRVLRRKPNCPVLGMGLVRGVDPVNREILILSSLPEEEILKVNCILSGRLDLPVSLMLPRISRDVDEPYIGETVNLGIGRTSIRKERPHLKGPHR